MKLLLMGGLPSSGSTLLMYHLSKNPNVLCLPETGLFTQGKLFDPKETPNQLHSTVPWINIKAKLFYATGWDFFNSEEATLNSIMEGISDQIDTSDAQFVVEKTPENVFAFNSYLRTHPKGKVILTSRDLESVCFSLMKRKLSLHEALTIWFSHAYEVYNLLEKYPDQAIHVTYKELCNNPEQTMNRIYTAIKIKKQKNEEAMSADRTRYDWLLKKSSWHLSNRYWSNNIDASVVTQTKTIKLGVEFESLLDTVAFMTPDNCLIKPRHLDQALQNKFKPLESASRNQYNPVEISSNSLLMGTLFKTYPLHIIKE